MRTLNTNYYGYQFRELNPNLENMSLFSESASFAVDSISSEFNTFQKDENSVQRGTKRGRGFQRSKQLDTTDRLSGLDSQEGDEFGDIFNQKHAFKKNKIFVTKRRMKQTGTSLSPEEHQEPNPEDKIYPQKPKFSKIAKNQKFRSALKIYQDGIFFSLNDLKVAQDTQNTDKMDREPFQGYGIFWYKTGDFYIGSWLRGLPHGYGYFYLIDSGMFFGEIKGGLASGYGILHKPEKDFFYEGEFELGRMSGKGYVCSKETSYDVLMNRGKIVFSTKNKNHPFLQRKLPIYINTFQDELLYLSLCLNPAARFPGVLRNLPGAKNLEKSQKKNSFWKKVYFGERVKRDKHGAGTLFRVDGSRYHGMFLDNKPYGIGVLVGNDNSFEMGFFRKKRLDLFGISHQTGGDVYIGGFASGAYHGPGLCYSEALRKWLFGCFDRGELCKEYMSHSGKPDRAHYRLEGVIDSLVCSSFDFGPEGRPRRLKKTILKDLVDFSKDFTKKQVEKIKLENKFFVKKWRAFFDPLRPDVEPDVKSFDQKSKKNEKKKKKFFGLEWQALKHKSRGERIKITERLQGYTGRSSFNPHKTEKEVEDEIQDFLLKNARPKSSIPELKLNLTQVRMPTTSRSRENSQTLLRSKNSKIMMNGPIPGNQVGMGSLDQAQYSTLHDLKMEMLENERERDQSNIREIRGLIRQYGHMRDNESSHLWSKTDGGSTVGHSSVETRQDAEFDSKPGRLMERFLKVQDPQRGQRAYQGGSQSFKIEDYNESGTPWIRNRSKRADLPETQKPKNQPKINYFDDSAGTLDLPESSGGDNMQYSSTERSHRRARNEPQGGRGIEYKRSGYVIEQDFAPRSSERKPGDDKTAKDALRKRGDFSDVLDKFDRNSASKLDRFRYSVNNSPSSQRRQREVEKEERQEREEMKREDYSNHNKTNKNKKNDGAKKSRLRERLIGMRNRENSKNSRKTQKAKNGKKMSKVDMIMSRFEVKPTTLEDLSPRNESDFEKIQLIPPLEQIENQGVKQGAEKPGLSIPNDEVTNYSKNGTMRPKFESINLMNPLSTDRDRDVEGLVLYNTRAQEGNQSDRNHLKRTPKLGGLMSPDEVEEAEYGSPVRFFGGSSARSEGLGFSSARKVIGGGSRTTSRFVVEE